MPLYGKGGSRTPPPGRGAFKPSWALGPHLKRLQLNFFLRKPLPLLGAPLSYRHPNAMLLWIYGIPDAFPLHNGKIQGKVAKCR